MKENESRKARKRAENDRHKKNDSESGISKVYYWIIGILFLILIVLTVFIFTQSGGDIDLENENNQTGEEQEQELADETAETEESEVSDVEEENEDVATEEVTDAEEEEEDTSETIEEESTDVNEDAPLDESYTVDYSEGSADRTAIRNQVMQATGLDNNLIEWWIGNNGPGRVEATVSNSEQTEVYRVYLQYGEGSWHVTNFESLPEVPANLR